MAAASAIDHHSNVPNNLSIDTSTAQPTDNEEENDTLIPNEGAAAMQSAISSMFNKNNNNNNIGKSKHNRSGWTSSIDVCLTPAAYSLIFSAHMLVNKYILTDLNFTFPTVYQGWQNLVKFAVLAGLSHCQLLERGARRHSRRYLKSERSNGHNLNYVDSNNNNNNNNNNNECIENGSYSANDSEEGYDYRNSLRSLHLEPTVIAPLHEMARQWQCWLLVPFYALVGYTGSVALSMISIPSFLAFSSIPVIAKLWLTQVVDQAWLGITGNSEDQQQQQSSSSTRRTLCKSETFFVALLICISTGLIAHSDIRNATLVGDGTPLNGAGASPRALAWVMLYCSASIVHDFIEMLTFSRPPPIGGTPPSLEEGSSSRRHPRRSRAAGGSGANSSRWACGVNPLSRAYACALGAAIVFAPATYVLGEALDAYHKFPFFRVISFNIGCVIAGISSAALAVFDKHFILSPKRVTVCANTVCNSVGKATTLVLSLPIFRRFTTALHVAWCILAIALPAVAAYCIKPLT